MNVQTDSGSFFRQMDTSRYLQYVNLVDTNHAERRFHFLFFYRFPNESALRLLLTCGSRWLDIDAIESTHGNTPLHIICANTRDRKIIKLLLIAGCHMDCVNNHGKIPLDYIEDKETRALFISKPVPSNLKCLCARMIANKQLNTECLGVSRSNLNKFILMHGGGSHIQSNGD